MCLIVTIFEEANIFVCLILLRHEEYIYIMYKDPDYNNAAHPVIFEEMWKNLHDHIISQVGWFMPITLSI